MIQVYYIRHSPLLAIGMALFVLLCLAALMKRSVWLTFLLLQFSLVVFSLAWIGQFYGHRIEDKKSSFLKDVQFLLMSQAGLRHFIYQRMGPFLSKMGTTLFYHDSYSIWLLILVHSGQMCVINTLKTIEGGSQS
jgi:uncharacterized membrane protein YGL010W